MSESYSDDLMIWEGQPFHVFVLGARGGYIGCL